MKVKIYSIPCSHPEDVKEQVFRFDPIGDALHKVPQKPKEPQLPAWLRAEPRPAVDLDLLHRMKSAAEKLAEDMTRETNRLFNLAMKDAFGLACSHHRLDIDPGIVEEMIKDWIEKKQLQLLVEHGIDMKTKNQSLRELYESLGYTVKEGCPHE